MTMTSMVVLLAVLATSTACLITNCPRGGKRSSPSEVSMSCMRCGPGGEGLCVGPGICCAPRAGCLLAPRGPCAHAPLEALPPRCLHAHPRARSHAAQPPLPCGADLTPDGSAPGRCAAQGVCCTQDSCRLDAVCFLPEDVDLEVASNDEGSQVDLRLAS